MKKTTRDLADPQHAKLVSKLGAVIAEAALAVATANGFSRQAAGVLCLRASLELMLLDNAPATVGAFVAREGSRLEALGGQGGNA